MGKKKLPLLRPREGSHIFGGIMMTLVVAMGYYNYHFATTGGWGPGPNKLPSVMNGNANNERSQQAGTTSSSSSTPTSSS
jgi:hypothetical protein